MYNKTMKTTPTSQSVETFLSGVSETRRQDAKSLMAMMQDISAQPPTMWGPSIIGFGSMHYKYESGHEGDMPILAFSPRKASLTIYFEGFDSYGDELKQLGKHKLSQACLYINKLADVDLAVLRDMLEQSYQTSTKPSTKPTSVEQYLAAIPAVARPKFDELRQLVKDTLPEASEVLSYGIIGYKIDDKRARVYISGWKDHLAIYPVPRSKDLQAQLKPYQHGKGSLWFKLDQPLPKSLIEATIKALSQ